MSRVVDIFAGGGGASEGLAQAGRPVDAAYDLDERMLAVHSANHPKTRHILADLRHAKPRGRAEVLWASPPCQDFSIAGGRAAGRGRDKLMWEVVRFARRLKPRLILVENVPPVHRWADWDAWCAAMRELGRLAHTVMDSADYGVPQRRKRRYIVVRADRAPEWPWPTHGAGAPLPWNPASSCIDWEAPGQSIFARRKPLAPRTLQRINDGFARLGETGMLVESQNASHPPSRATRSVSEPARTVGTGRDAGGFFVSQQGRADDVFPNRSRSVEEPAGTVVATGSAMLVSSFGTDLSPSRAKSVDCPSDAVRAGKISGAGLLVQTNVGGQRRFQRDMDIAEPCRTVPTRSDFAAVILGKHESEGGRQAKPVTEPGYTVSASGGNAGGALVEAQPMPPACAEPPWLRDYPTLSALWDAGVDVCLRMLSPRELARIMGFRESYIIAPAWNGKPLGKTHQVKAVGNAVCPTMSKALMEANA